MEPAEYDRMDAAESSMWWYRALHRRLIAALADAGGAVLDAGCGTGGLLAHLRSVRRDLRLTGLELTEPAARRAATKAGVPVARGSIDALPFADQAFDVAIAADLLCHAAVEPAEGPVRIAPRAATPPEGSSSICRRTGGCFRRMIGRCTTRAAPPRAGLQQSCGRRASSTSARPTGTGCCCPLVVAQRKLRARDRAASDVAAFPTWIDATFHAITEIERRLPFCLPAGSSVLATAERP